MAFVAVPNSGQSLGQTRDQLRNNINELKNSLAINHYDLDLANTGKHLFVNMPIHALPTTAAGEGELHTQTVSSNTQLFYSRDNVAGSLVQLTAGDTSNANFAAVTNGWTFLPGGLIMQYGSVSAPGGGGTVTFPVAFTTGVYTITFGFSRVSNSSAHAFWVNSGTPPTLTQFTYASDTTGSVFMYWNAIGK